MPYTPSTTFVFAGGDYAPPSTFVFSDQPPETVSGTLVGTLEGVAGQFSGTYYENAGVIAGVLAGVSGSIGGVIAPQGVLVGTLEGITGQFVAAVVPQGVLAGTLDGLTGSFAGHNVANAGVMSGSLEGVSGSISGHYNPNVHRFVVSELCAAQHYTSPLNSDNLLTRRQAVYIPAAACAPQQDATPAGATTQAVFEETQPAYLKACATVKAGAFLSNQTAADLQQLTPVDMIARAIAEQATPVDSGIFSVLYQLELIFTKSRHPVDDAGLAVHTFLRRAYGEPPEQHRYTPGAAFVFDTNPTYSPADPFVWPYAVPAIDLTESQQLGGIRHGVYAHWQRATRHRLHQCHTVQAARRPPPGTSLWIDPPRPPPVTPPGHSTLTIPVQSSYIMQHSLSVTLLDLTPIDMALVRLNYDADAFAWQFSGQLADKAQLPLVRQPAGQPPVQLVVTINGYSWKVLVEKIQRGQEFAKNSITLTGRGLTALLGQPYEQPASATQGSALTVQQLAELHLPPGWTLNWTAQTWLVPAGAYSYNNQTPIQALAAIASDIGAMLVPARDSQTIAIMPRYPILPWDFALATPDVIIPEAVIVSVNEQTVAPSQANAVYVHGAEIGGVLAWCRLNGTAGDRLAPSVSNALLTDVTGCRSLGERILAGQYEQPGIQSVTLPMDGVEIPLLSVGQLAEITVDGSPVRGIVNGIAIEATLASVRQAVQIGEETPNHWTLFKDLLPRDPLLVATLSSTDGTTSIMTLLDGGVVRVRGTGTPGDKYYIRAGKIDGEAPNMAQNEVVI
jgi:hypothetical protein